MPAAKDAVKASVLVLNGADDRGTAGDIAGFQEEMNAAGVDWQFVNFSDTVHCFALPPAKSPPGCLYNPLSAKRAENMMADFFEERFEDDATSEDRKHVVSGKCVSVRLGLGGRRSLKTKNKTISHTNNH